MTRVRFPAPAAASGIIDQVEKISRGATSVEPSEIMNIVNSLTQYSSELMDRLSQFEDRLCPVLADHPHDTKGSPPIQMSTSSPLSVSLLAVLQALEHSSDHLNSMRDRLRV